VYLTNLAAALLKLQRFDAAESAAERALYYEPKNIKARYRRGLARKGNCEYDAAISGTYRPHIHITLVCAKRHDARIDFRSVLRLDPSSTVALTELDQTHTLLAQVSLGAPLENDEVHSETFTAKSDLVTESDSSEFAHEGNGIPCRYNNHNGCRHGAQCRFKHAPDNKSVRDEL